MPLDLQRVQALCFDVDGTLSDTDDYYVAGIARRLRAIPLVSNPRRLARRLVMWMESPGNALMGLADRAGLDDEIITVLDWVGRHRPRRTRAIPLVPGVREMLRNLDGRFPMAIVSARDEDSALSFLDLHGIRGHFAAIVTALSAPHTKPYPDPVLLAAEKLGVAARACIMVGDTTVDIRAGRNAGAQTVGVLCGFGEEPELRRQGADLILPGTADLQEALLGVSGAAASVV